jgi:transcriptional regulator with XRE-family HTH domain
MSHNGIFINSLALKHLRQNKKLSQEALSYLSLERKCYISVATLKRAELGKPVSRQTLDKLVKFFDDDCSRLFLINSQMDCNDGLDFRPTLDPVIIHWDMLYRLSLDNEHKYISYICSELHALLLKFENDEVVSQVFSRD